jgi:molybdopterin synthase catalytic subunit/molybdopterin converting factor small subunit
MKLRVLLFAGLRERAGVGELTCVNLPAQLDLAGLKSELERRHPELGSLGHVAGVIGERYVPDDTPLEDGLEVALLPPVSGGEEMGGDDGGASLERGVFELAHEPIDLVACSTRVEHASCGAVVLFSGNVRDTNRGESVARIDYEAFERMAHPEMGRIFERCLAEHGEPAPGAEGPGERYLRMLCVHRVGAVGVGESSVVIAVASPHRVAAFDAARFLIDELKKSLPVWKKEVYAAGHHWIGDRS